MKLLPPRTTGVFRWHRHPARGGDHGVHGSTVRGGVPGPLLSGHVLGPVRRGGFRPAGSVLWRVVRGLERVGSWGRDRGHSRRVRVGESNAVALSPDYDPMPDRLSRRKGKVVDDLK